MPTADDDGMEARERAHRFSEVLAGEAHEQHLGGVPSLDLARPVWAEHWERVGHPGNSVVVEAHRALEVSELALLVPTSAAALLDMPGAPRNRAALSTTVYSAT